MRVELTVESTDTTGRTFLTWSPMRARARITDNGGAAAPIPVTLRNGGSGGGGRLVFDTVRGDDDKAEIVLSLPPDGTPVDFWVAGEFQQPSQSYGDAAIEAVAGAAPVGRLELMVRIRKDATALTPAERDRFLQALGQLNGGGLGIFQKFRDSHVAESLDESHGYPGFPPWHRAYLLDLERSLQAIDPSVTLPYWRFDRPAKPLFAPEFLGMPPDDSSKGDTIDFPHGHPLEFWKTDQADPIQRRPRYPIDGVPPQTRLVNGRTVPFVISEAATMQLGDQYPDFRGYDYRRGGLEFAPHGSAHVCFDGPVNYPPTAPKDPLFFLLHCNVDRLWARWQWLKKRWNADDPAVYALKGPIRDPDDLGHKLDDTLWPWNGEAGDGTAANPRPEFTPPRQPFPDSPIVPRPGPVPKIRDMIDYQGVLEEASLGFDYDDVPFELP